MFNDRYWSVVLFSCNVFVWLWYQGDAGLIGWVKKVFPLLLSLKEIVETWYNIFFKCLVEFTSKSIWAWCLLVWKVINYLEGYKLSISLIDIGLLRLSISSCVSFGNCVFQGIGAFHVGYQICGHRVVHSFPLLSF